MWKPLTASIAIVILISFFYVEVIFILLGGIPTYLCYKLISTHFQKLSEHKNAKKDPIGTLRRISGTKIHSDSFNKEGVVYAFIQKKLHLNDSQKRNNNDLDYYDGNAMNLGYTMDDPDIRAFDLSLEYGNRIFDPYIICKVNRHLEVGKKVHELLNDKTLWREMFDVSVMDAESIIKDAINKIDGAEILDFECRKERPEIFNSSENLRSYRRSMREKLFAEGKIKKSES